jgi:hypothetical protein
VRPRWLSKRRQRSSALFALGRQVKEYQRLHGPLTSPTDGPTIQARHQAWCTVCGTEVKPGEWIFKTWYLGTLVWVHQACPSPLKVAWDLREIADDVIVVSYSPDGLPARCARCGAWIEDGPRWLIQLRYDELNDCPGLGWVGEECVRQKR